jgi:hypothetical protein
MNLLYDSFHLVDFSISGGGSLESVLLRRRKLLRWNKGARFHLLPGQPSHAELLDLLADEERTATRTLLAKRSPRSQQAAAESTAAAVAAAAEGVYAAVAAVAAGDASSSSSSSSSTWPLEQDLPFWRADLPAAWEFGALAFDLRRVAKRLGPRQTFLHVAHRLAHRFRYLRADANANASIAAAASALSAQKSPRGEYMCDASTFGRWANAVADGYSEANPYHSALHAADVMLTASVRSGPALCTCTP